MDSRKDKLTNIIEPLVIAEGFELVRVRVGGSRVKTLQIMAERPDGTMSAEDCASLSRALSPALDTLDPIEAAYILEISSPGIDRPLTRLKDFVNFDGFEAKIELEQVIEGRKRYRGVLAGVEGDNVCIDLEGEQETTLIPYALIAQAKLVLTDAVTRESLTNTKKKVGVSSHNDENVPPENVE